MEEQAIFYFAFAAGMLLFASMLGLAGSAADIALEGEARALIENLQTTVEQVGSAPAGAYAELEFTLPGKVGTKEYEVRFLSGRVTVITDSKSFGGGINVANAVRASGSETLRFYKEANNEKVFVQKR